MVIHLAVTVRLPASQLFHRRYKVCAKIYVGTDRKSLKRYLFKRDRLASFAERSCTLRLLRSPRHLLDHRTKLKKLVRNCQRKTNHNSPIGSNFLVPGFKLQLYLLRTWQASKAFSPLYNSTPNLPPNSNSSTLVEACTTSRWCSLGLQHLEGCSGRPHSGLGHRLVFRRSDDPDAALMPVHMAHTRKAAIYHGKLETMIISE